VLRPVGKTPCSRFGLEFSTSGTETGRYMLLRNLCGLRG
jgi:hypothetical protein